jgi:hypothetical protein
VDKDGIIATEGKCSSDPGSISAWLSDADVRASRIGLDIGGVSRCLCIELKARGWPAICIDPHRLRGLTKTMWVKTEAGTRAVPKHTLSGDVLSGWRPFGNVIVDDVWALRGGCSHVSGL